MSTINYVAAQSKTIFFIECLAGVCQVNSMYLADFILQSATEVTSPRGIMTELFIDPAIVSDGDTEVYGFELKQWLSNSRSRVIDFYTSEEDAEQERFERIYKFDFLEDDQRDTMYFETAEEAEQEMASRLY